MIKRLQIKNFRTHKKEDITFSPYVNSIIGRNAVGKSTIIRAIRWVVRNKPAGDSVINWDSKKAAVRLTIDENKVTRTRGKGINTYQLNKKKPYKAFRNNVPKDIEKVINLSDINFQGQHDAPFWFCKTAGEVSRQLNAIINLEVIDETLSNITSIIRKSKATIEIIKDRLENADTNQKSLAYAEDMNTELKRAELLQSLHQTKAEEMAALSVVMLSVYNNTQTRDNMRKLTRYAHSAMRRGEKHQDLSNKVTVGAVLVEAVTHWQEIIRLRPPSIKPLEQLRKKMKRCRLSRNTLQEYIYEKEEMEKDKCQAIRKVQIGKKELEKIAGGRCLLCGKKK